ncbi:anti-phage protein KwaA [Exiguobacterium sp. CH10]|uniref:anti-phage protein KwaA n=1 Tax=Exiguobacterium sp. CH10 TaxID=2751261 RepID=UPI001BE81C85|nr:anti-phage protein KwaA [Exiguobacterium sp. CH10]
MIKSSWDKIELYIISLWLLFILIIVVTIDVPICIKDNCSFIGFDKLILKNLIPIVSFSFFLLGVVFMYRFKYKLQGSQRNNIIVKKIENRNYEHLTFLTTYIIPLIAFDLTKIKYVIVLFLLLVAIGVMYVKTNIFYTNPTLALLGYRIYRIDAEVNGNYIEGIIIISKENVSLSDTLSYRKIHEDIYYVRVRI